MAEEQTVETPVVDDQDVMASAYFSDYELVEDEDSYVGKPGATQKDGKSDEEVDDEDENIVDNNNETKPPVEEKTGDVGTEKTPKVEGFTSFFQKDDESGQKTFDMEKLMGFVDSGDKAKRFAYAGREFTEQPEGQSKQGEPEKAEWERRVEERYTAKQETRNKFTLYRQAYVQARNNGADEVQAIRLADEHVERILRQEEQKLDLEAEKQREKMAMENGQSVHKKAITERDASANEHRLASRFESEDAYRQFMYGEGAPVINMMFDLMNPDKSKGLTVDQTKEEMRNWWHNLASDENKLQFVHDVVLGKWVLQNLSQFVDYGKNLTSQHAASSKAGSRKAPGGIGISPKQSKQGDGLLQSYFNGTRFQGDVGLPEV